MVLSQLTISMLVTLRSFILASVLPHSLLQGAEIGINIGWKCNLDLNIELCVPKYSFTRLDAPFAKNAVSKGYNFRWCWFPLMGASIHSLFLHKVWSFCSCLSMQICQIFQDREWDWVSETPQSICDPIWCYGHWQCELSKTAAAF